MYRNFQALLDCSERDTLTGLLNRQTFDDSFLRIATHAPPPALARPAAVIGSPSSAFVRADKAVYYAKQHGRDPVRDHPALVAPRASWPKNRATATSSFSRSRPRLLPAQASS